MVGFFFAPQPHWRCSGSCRRHLPLEPVTFFARTGWRSPSMRVLLKSVADGHLCRLRVFLIVTIAQGGPRSEQPRLSAGPGKIQFHMGGNLLEAFSAVNRTFRSRLFATSFHGKEPQSYHDPSRAKVSTPGMEPKERRAIHFGAMPASRAIFMWE